MKKLILLKYRVMDGICSLRNNNKGMGTVEIILIIVEIYTYKRYVYPVYSIP